MWENTCTFGEIDGLFIISKAAISIRHHHSLSIFSIALPFANSSTSLSR